MSDASELRKRAAELAPWYQNIQLAPEVFTKALDGDRDIFSSQDIPGPLWQAIARDLPDLTGLEVLDIGCNAGYMSFEAKRLGASRVTGIDSNLGAGRSFIEQAEFCREVLELDVEFEEISFFDYSPPKPFDVVLFCGVLYHLEDFAGALDAVKSFCKPGGLMVLETAVEERTLSIPGDSDYLGDPTTFFVPSVPVLLELLRERECRIEIVRRIGTRAVVFGRY